MVPRGKKKSTTHIQEQEPVLRHHPQMKMSEKETEREKGGGGFASVGGWVWAGEFVPGVTWQLISKVWKKMHGKMTQVWLFVVRLGRAKFFLWACLFMLDQVERKSFTKKEDRWFCYTVLSRSPSALWQSSYCLLFILVLFFNHLSSKIILFWSAWPINKRVQKDTISYNMVHRDKIITMW